MTADAILYACNTVAVGLFGIVLSAAFCNIRWTRRNVCCMVASTLAIFLIQGIVYLGIDPARAVSLPPPYSSSSGDHPLPAEPRAALAGDLCADGVSLLPAPAVAGAGVRVGLFRGRSDAVCGGADRDAAAAAPAAADGPGSAVYFPLFSDRPVPVRLHASPVLRL